MASNVDDGFSETSTNKKNVVGQQQAVKTSRGSSSCSKSKNTLFGEEEDDFKKPLFKPTKSDREQNISKPPPLVVTRREDASEPNASSASSSIEDMQRIRASIPYKEPSWGGLTFKPYSFDVLKDGSIVDNLDLTDKSFYIFGRLPTCDVTLEHPSLSRYHTCIQHCAATTVEGGDRYQQGWYLYDLDSTHGTWINKVKVPPKVYHRIRVGHVIKFGGSSRLFILQGPEEDQEEESELSVDELKLLREKQKKEAELLRQGDFEEDPNEVISRDDGCMWGMDMPSAAEENPENPFSQEMDESFYIDDPKKSLKNYFDREGYDAPEYESSAEGAGRFKCCLQLPIDDSTGHPIIAEATVSGKKREAVEACALEACHILDRHGVLRAATHESRKRRKKNWEENDFYDSDEDTFLDRTGTIEKKREQRMKKAGKLDDKAETYDSLSEKHAEILKEMAEIEQRLEKARADAEAVESNEEMDVLDAYMNSIKAGVMDTKTRLKLKRRMLELRPQEQRLRKLVNIAKPPSLPELKPKLLGPKPEAATITSSSSKPKVAVPMFGKMKGLNVPKALKVFTVSLPTNVVTRKEPEVEEEEDDDDNEDEGMDADRQQEVGNKKCSQQTANSRKRHVSFPSCQTANWGQQTKCQTESKMPGKTAPDRSESFETSRSPLFSVTKAASASHSSSSPPPPTSSFSKSSLAFPAISFSKPLSATNKKVTPHITGSLAHTHRILLEESQKSKKPQKTGGNSSCFDPDPDKVVWLPPKGQTGDGRTSLNEKYGY